MFGINNTSNSKFFIIIFWGTFCLSMIILVIFSFWLYFFPHVFGTIFPVLKSEALYNETLLSRGSGEEIFRVTHITLSWFEANLLELKWDTLYVQSWSKDAIIEFYKSALVFWNQDRLYKKIALLEESSLPVQDSTWSVEQKDQTKDFWEKNTTEIEQSLDRIDDATKKRWNYLQKPNTSQMINDNIHFLDISKEQIDW